MIHPEGVKTFTQAQQWIDQEKNHKPKMLDDFGEGWFVCLDHLQTIINNLIQELLVTQLLPFKVGQVVRRTSDGLKCLIHEDWCDNVYLVQLNNGKQFGEGCHLRHSPDVTNDELAKMSCGYCFVTEKQGKEMGLAWAKNPCHSTDHYSHH